MKSGNPTLGEEAIETRLKEAKSLYKKQEMEKAAAGFKWVRGKAAERWQIGMEPRDAFTRLRAMQVDAQVGLVHSQGVSAWLHGPCRVSSTGVFYHTY